MVRTAHADEASLDEHVNKLFRKKISLEVGLIIGRPAASSKNYILALVPTPPTSTGTAPLQTTNGTEPHGTPAKKGKKGRPGSDAKGGDASLSVMLEEDWIAEHARQISRMLLGGIQVLGLYIFSPETTFKNSAPTLWQAVKAVAESSAIGPLTRDVTSFEPLLLHICSSPKRFTCRTCSCVGTFSPSSLHPCDLKFGKLLGNFHSFACTYTVDISVAVKRTVQANLRRSVEEAIAKEGVRLEEAEALVDGELAAAEKALGGASASSAVHEVELFVPPHWELSESSEKAAQFGFPDSASGMIRLQGEIHSRAYAYQRETIGSAVCNLKADIIGSLKARLELLVDEAEQAMEEEEGERGEKEEERGRKVVNPLLASGGDTGDGLEKPYVCGMPRRILVQWGNGIMLGDYLMAAETLEDAKERCKAMLGLEIEGEIVEPENDPSLPKAANWAFTEDELRVATEKDVGQVKGLSEGNGRKEGTRSASLLSFGSVGALLLAVLAAVVAYLWSALRRAS